METFLRKSAAFGVALSFLITAARADQFDNLTPRFSGSLQTLRASTYANSLYVAVGENGTILTSADSITWQPQSSGTTNRLNAVRYGTNGFVAVGESATILKSPDGLTWTQVPSPVTNNLSGITYSNGRYVVVGSKGLILTSTNAASWAPISTGALYDFNAVEIGLSNVIGGPIFVAVGDSGLVMTSPDGLVWTARSSGISSNLRAVAQWKRTWVAVGDSGTVANSPDGVTWTMHDSATTSNLLGLSSDGRSHFGAVGDGGVFVITSDAGSSWTLASSGTTNRLYGMNYANAAHLAVGEAGTIQSGYVFLTRSSGTAINLSQIVYGNGMYIAVGITNQIVNTNGGHIGVPYGIILSSTNAIDWTPQAVGTSTPVISIAFGINQFVAVGYSGTILTSTNGSVWTHCDIGATNSLTSIVSANGTFIIQGYYPGKFGSSPAIGLSSTNGTNWTYIEPLPAFLPTRAVQANNRLVGINRSRTLASSINGKDWFVQSTSALNNLYAVSYGNGLFAAVGDFDLSMPTQIFSSPDGTNWTSRSTGSMVDSGLAFGGPGFVAVGMIFDFVQPGLQTSADGITWTTRGIDTQEPCNDILFANGTFVAVGPGGAIVQSVPSNSRALPRMTATLSNSQFQITACAQPGYTYRIQKSTNPVYSNWTDAFTFTSTQTFTNFIDSSSSSTCFYRIVSP